MIDWEIYKEAYRQLQNPDLKIWNNEESNLLREISWFRTSNWEPEKGLVGCFLCCFDSQRKVFLEALRIISVISFRFKIVDGGSFGDLNERFYRIGMEANFDLNRFKEELRDVYIDDSQLIEKFQRIHFNLKNRNRKILARYILCKLEQRLTKEEIDWARVGRSKGCTLEHLHPNWEGIGNLTLLEFHINNRLGSKPYEQKREHYQESQFRITQNIAQHYDSFGGMQIRRREKEIAELSCQIWKIDF